MFGMILNICRRVLYWVFRAIFARLNPKKGDVRTSTTSVTTSSTATSGSVTVTQTSLTASAQIEGILEYPVVIIHGFADRPTMTGVENLAETVLSEIGIEHFTPQIEVFGSIFERSKSLIKQIASKYPGRTVHLIAHSMGGLNARDITSLSMTTDLGFKIKTVTTLASPLRGIKAIDFVPDFDDTNVFAKNVRDLIGTDLGALGDMSHEAMSNYNKTHPYNPDVKYFTWAGETDVPSPLFAITFPITRVFGATDGLINVDSATWGPDLGGPGTHLGTLHGADHASVVGRTVILGSIPHIRAAELGKSAAVKALDNTLFGAISRSIRGTVDSLLGPVRATLTGLGLLGTR